MGTNAFCLTPIPFEMRRTHSWHVHVPIFIFMLGAIANERDGGGPLHGQGLSLPRFGEVSDMIRISDSGRGVGRRLALAAAAMLVLSAAPIQRAEALSLINPGAAPTAKAASGGLTTEVRGGHGGGGGGGGGSHGGGGSFHGGGGGVHIGGSGFHAAGGGAVFHGGSGMRYSGAVFHGGGYRSGPVFHGAGVRYGGHRFAGYRFAPRHHFHHRRFFGAAYYAYPYDDYPYYYSYRRCHTVWTYYGPRRVCHYPHWRHHYWRHHHHRHHHHRIYW
jgi:hypothetical protein